mmetsp:Transcript_72794/g.161785  ORF Transcript_72794/g.161785 Transcript_72794/m.161785 type:complete len:219 (+) Transcript_72794:659-1315(+)
MRSCIRIQILRFCIRALSAAGVASRRSMCASSVGCSSLLRRRSSKLKGWVASTTRIAAARSSFGLASTRNELSASRVSCSIARNCSHGSLVPSVSTNSATWPTSSSRVSSPSAPATGLLALDSRTQKEGSACNMKARRRLAKVNCSPGSKTWSGGSGKSRGSGGVGGGMPTGDATGSGGPVVPPSADASSSAAGVGAEATSNTGRLSRATSCSGMRLW